MEAIMTNVLDESEDISLDLLRLILASVRKENQVLLLLLLPLLLLLISWSPLFFIPNLNSFYIITNWLIPIIIGSSFYFMETGRKGYVQLCY